MDTPGLLSLHDRLSRQARNLMEKKNHDYAGGDRTPFANFEMAEHLGLCSTAQGVLIRLSDKLSRLAMFEKAGVLEVADEKIEDTILDIINYAVIYAALTLDVSAHSACKHDLEAALVQINGKTVDPHGIPVGTYINTEHVQHP